MRNWLLTAGLWVWCQCAVVSLEAQPVSNAHPYTIRLEQSTSLASVLAQLEQQYHLTFAYASGLADDRRIGPVRVTAANLEELLEKFFTGTGFDIQITSGNKVLLRESAELNTLSYQTPVLQGQIKDAATGEVLTAAVVYFDSISTAVYSDEQGRFTIKLPPGYSSEGRLYIQLLGYQEIALPLESALKTRQISLRSRPQMLQMVTVVDKLPSNVPEPLSIGLKMPGDRLSAFNPAQLAGNDPFRAIQLLPGVAAHDDNSAGIKIRGSQADETLIVLDGIPIYKADHFFGIFSSINGMYVQDVALYKNALPVEYGGKTGGMLLMRSPQEVLVRDALVEVNLLTSSLKLSTPLGKDHALILSGRTTYANAANSGLFKYTNRDPETQFFTLTNISRDRQTLDLEPAFRFYDWNAKWKVGLPAKAGKLEVNAYNSRDHLSTLYQKEFPIRNSQQSNTTGEMHFENESVWYNLGFSANYQVDLSKNRKLRAQLYSSKYELEEGLETAIETERPENSNAFSNEQYNQVFDAGGQLLFEQALRRDRFKAGITVQVPNVSYALFQDDSTFLRDEGQTTLATVFGNYTWVLRPGWELDAGSRVTYNNINRKNYFAPRLQSTYSLAQGWSLKASYSRNFQYVREIEYENRLGQSITFMGLGGKDDFPAGQSDQFMLGTGFKKGAFQLDVEFFDKYRKGVLEFSQTKPAFSSDTYIGPPKDGEFRIFEGNGRSYGMDLLLSLEQKWYSGWISYTLSKTTEQFEEILKNEPFPSQEDRRHQFKWVNNLHWKHWNFSLNYLYSSGRPYTDVSMLTKDQDRRQLPPSDRIKYLPFYERIDIGAAYQLQFKQLRATLGASVFNLTNRNNVQYVQYIASIPGSRPGDNRVVGFDTNLLDRTFNLSLRLNW